MALAVDVVVRYRKAVTYGVHAVLAALETSGVEHRQLLGVTPEETAAHIAASRADRVLVLWSFYSPDAEAMAAELAAVRSLSDGRGLHIAGGVHATAEPQQVLDAGWDLAAIGEGESTIIALVEALRRDEPLTTVPGLAVKDADGVALRTRPAPQLPLDAFPSFLGRKGPIEITRGCRYTCRFCQTPFMFGGQFRHRSVASVREHVKGMVEQGLRDVRRPRSPTARRVPTPISARWRSCWRGSRRSCRRTAGCSSAASPRRCGPSTSRRRPCGCSSGTSPTTT